MKGSARTLVCLLTGLLLLTPVGTWADQQDPELPMLFELLANARSAREAARIESQIWSRWLATGDPHTDRLVRDGIEIAETGRLDLAIGVFDEVIDRLPEYAEGWNQRATMFYLVRDYEAALADIEQVLELEPRHFGALSGRGLIHLATGHDIEALIAFEAVLEIHPYAREARRYVEFLRRRLGAETV